MDTWAVPRGLEAHLGDVHGQPVAGGLQHGLQPLGLAQVHLGALHIVLLLGPQRGLQELLLAALQEGQLLLGCGQRSLGGAARRAASRQWGREGRSPLVDAALGAALAVGADPGCGAFEGAALGWAPGAAELFCVREGQKPGFQGLS